MSPLRLSSKLSFPATLLALAALGAVACDDTSSTGTGGTSGSTTSSSTSTTTSSSSTGTGGDCTGIIGAGDVCAGTGFGGGETSQATASVKAKIVDEKGAPVVGQPVYICGVDICSEPGTTGADGSVTLATTLPMMKRPAFKFGDSVEYAELGIPLLTATTDFTTVGTGVLATGKLTGTTGAPFAAGASVKSGDVTIDVPAGGSVVVNTLVYDTCEKQDFHAATVPMTNLGPVLDPVMVSGVPADFKVLYAVGPAGTTLCPAAKVTVALPHATTQPNDFGWAPGAKVEFWVMTLDASQEYAPYAGWAKASDGVVSADGTTASTVEPGGFAYLDNFAVRLAQ